MKKLILVLAIALIATQAFGVTVELQRAGSTNVINVVYSSNGSTAATRMRAVALDLTSPATTTMTLVPGSFQTGESTSAARKYGIYPATIAIDSTGSVTGYGTPLAAGTDPAPGADGTNHIVLEFGSLYYADTNAPGASGTLCSFTFNPASTSNPVITLIDEDTYRGGLVMEDGTLGAVSQSFTYTTAVAPGQASNPTPATAATKVSVTQDLSWTEGTGATSRDVFFGTVNPPVTKVIADGTALTYDTGTMARNTTYYWRVDEKNSAGTTAGIVWNFKTECFPNPGSAKYIQWTNVGKPDCWCALINPRQCHGDADGGKETKSNFYAASNDLNVLVAAWNKNYATIAGLTAGVPATPLICADFDHVTETKSNFRVASLDLNILVASWNKANLPDANCSVAGY